MRNPLSLVNSLNNLTSHALFASIFTIIFLVMVIYKIYNIAIAMRNISNNRNRDEMFTRTNNNPSQLQMKRVRTTTEATNNKETVRLVNESNSTIMNQGTTTYTNSFSNNTTNNNNSTDYPTQEEVLN